MPFSPRQALIAASAALGLGAVAFGGYMASRMLISPVTVALEPEAGCDLQRVPCRALLPAGGQVMLSISPRPIPLVKPVTLDVEINGLDADEVEADISTADMYTGPNRRKLRAVTDAHYTAETMLGTCTRDTMRWRATVRVRDGRTIYSVPFEFLTRNSTAKKQQ